MAKCKVCFWQCEIAEGGYGACGARSCRDGQVVPINYGIVSSMALDPIEKKPLRNFCPGSSILSVGSLGCNLRCPFCQNDTISWSDRAKNLLRSSRLESITPSEVLEAAERYRGQGNIGVAYTYNEPLVGYEFVRDCAREVHGAGMKNVLVTNGSASLEILSELEPYIDAMNIDLKGFTDRYYREVLGGDRGMVMRFIERAVQFCHVELTTLIVPGENDTEEEMRSLSSWIAELKGVEGSRIPLHISRFFPRFHMTDREATDIELIYRLADVAREKLEYVYTGNC